MATTKKKKATRKTTAQRGMAGPSPKPVQKRATGLQKAPKKKKGRAAVQRTITTRRQILTFSREWRRAWRWFDLVGAIAPRMGAKKAMQAADEIMAGGEERFGKDAFNR